jgi:hypothetical protein
MAKKSGMFPRKDDSKTFKNSEAVLYQASPKFNVIHRENCSLEITVGRELLRFEAHGINPVWPEKYKKGLPKEIIEHPDFQTAKKYFTVVKQ